MKATLSNCGKALRALLTTFNWKLLKGTRLIVVPKGKKSKDWVIRIQAPKFILNMGKVQRLNGSGRKLKI
jgi:hypothetical protein